MSGYKWLISRHEDNASPAYDSTEITRGSVRVGHNPKGNIVIGYGSRIEYNPIIPDGKVDALGRRVITRDRGKKYSRWINWSLTFSERNGKVYLYYYGPTFKGPGRRGSKVVRDLSPAAFLTGRAAPGVSALNSGLMGLMLYRRKDPLSRVLVPRLFFYDNKVGDELIDVISNALTDRFGTLDIRGVAYPALKGMDRLKNFSGENSRAYRKDHILDAIPSQYQKKSIRKAVLSGLEYRMERDYRGYGTYCVDAHIAVMNSLPKDWPVDYVKDVIDIAASKDIVSPLRPHITEFLGAIPEKKVAQKVIVKHYEEHHRGLLEDSAAMWRQAGRPQVRGGNLDRIHDNLVTAFTEYKNPDREIEYPETHPLPAIHGMSDGEHVVVVPKRTREVQEWGRKQRHCVGSYGYRIVDDSTWIVGVLGKGENDDYCAEINPKTFDVRQFRGLQNREAPEEKQKWLQTQVVRKLKREAKKRGYQNSAERIHFNLNF